VTSCNCSYELEGKTREIHSDLKHVLASLDLSAFYDELEDMEALWVHRCFIPPTDYQMPSWAAMADSHCVANMPDQVVQRAAHLVIITYVHYKIRAGSRHGRTQRDLSTTIRKVSSADRSEQHKFLSSQLPTQGAREARPATLALVPTGDD